MSFVLSCALAVLSPASAFVPSPARAAGSQSALSLSRDDEVGTATRRGFLDNVATATAAIAGASSALMTPAPAMAYGLGKANDRLARWVDI